MGKKKSKNPIVDKSIYAGQSRNSIVKRIVKTQKLLEKFSVKAWAFDPGVQGDIIIPNSGGQRHSVNFGENEWRWLEPLLRELLNYRESTNRSIGMAAERVLKSCDLMDEVVLNEAQRQNPKTKLVH